MAKNWEFKDPIPFPADHVVATMTEPKFLEDWTVVQNGQNPHCKVVEKTDDYMKLEISYEAPLPMGVGVMKETLISEWNLKTRVNTWNRKSAGGVADKAGVSGSTSILEDGEGKSILHEKGTIEVKVKLIGKKLEEVIAKHLVANRKEKIDALLKGIKERFPG